MPDWDDYRHAVIWIDFDTKPVEIIQHDDTSDSGTLPLPADTTVHVITACNPGGTVVSEPENLLRLRALERDLDGLTWWPARGGDLIGEHIELSFAVTGLGDDETLALGRRHGQDAIFRLRGTELAIVACDGSRVEQRGWYTSAPIRRPDHSDALGDGRDGEDGRCRSFAAGTADLPDRSAPGWRATSA